MRPNYGSIIWDLLMEPADASTEQEIIDDVTKIISKEPRVELINASVFFLDYAIRVDVVLRYIPLDSVDTLYLEFQKDIELDQ